MEVCTLSRRGDRFIPYLRHYSRAFAFSIILYPLRHQLVLRPPLSGLTGQTPRWAYLVPYK